MGNTPSDASCACEGFLNQNGHYDREELQIRPDLSIPRGRFSPKSIMSLPALDQQLFNAAAGRNVAAVRWHISKGASVQALDEDRSSPLHVAARSGSSDIVRELVNGGASLDITDAAGWTALHVGSYCGRAEVVKILLDAGADPGILNRRGQTPFDVATSSQAVKVFLQFHNKVLALKREQEEREALMAANALRKESAESRSGSASSPLSPSASASASALASAADAASSSSTSASASAPESEGMYSSSSSSTQPSTDPSASASSEPHHPKLMIDPSRLPHIAPELLTADDATIDQLVSSIFRTPRELGIAKTARESVSGVEDNGGAGGIASGSAEKNGVASSGSSSGSSSSSASSAQNVSSIPPSLAALTLEDDKKRRIITSPVFAPDFNSPTQSATYVRPHRRSLLATGGGDSASASASSSPVPASSSSTSGVDGEASVTSTSTPSSIPSSLPTSLATVDESTSTHNSSAPSLDLAATPPRSSSLSSTMVDEVDDGIGLPRLPPYSRESTADYTANSRVHPSLSSSASINLPLNRGIRLFNLNPKKGLSFLIATGCVDPDANDIAAFLHNTPGLDKTQIGAYLGEYDQFNLDVLTAFTQQTDLANLDFIRALRFYLSTFRLPGEAQKIDRIMEAFAKRFYAQNLGQTEVDGSVVSPSSAAQKFFSTSPVSKSPAPSPTQPGLGRGSRMNSLRNSAAFSSSSSSSSPSSSASSASLLHRDSTASSSSSSSPAAAPPAYQRPSFKSPDAVYMLAFSTIMLNVDAHNPGVKNRMTKADWIRNNRGINGGEDFPPSFLEHMYDDIVSKQMAYVASREDLSGNLFTNPDNEGWLEKQGGRIKTWKERWFILSDNCLYYFKGPDEKTPQGFVPLLHLAVSDISKRKLTFSLTSTSSDQRVKSAKFNQDGLLVQGNHSKFVVRAKNEQDFDIWVGSIENGIEMARLKHLAAQEGNNSSNVIR